MSRSDEPDLTDPTQPGSNVEILGTDEKDAAPDPQPDLTAPMEFEDLAPVHVPVRVGDQRYVLVEASADAEAKWRNFQIRCTKIQNNQLHGLDGIADSKIQLLGLCLFYANPDGSVRTTRVSRRGESAEDVPDAVPLSVIRKFSSRIVDDLFERAKRISRLDDGGTGGALFGGNRGNG